MEENEVGNLSIRVRGNCSSLWVRDSGYPSNTGDGSMSKKKWSFWKQSKKEEVGVGQRKDQMICFNRGDVGLQPMLYHPFQNRLIQSNYYYYSLSLVPNELQVKD